MAVLILSNDRAWFSSASLLSYVAERMQSSGNFIQFEKELSTVAGGWQAFDATRMTEKEIAELRSIAVIMISEALADGPDKRGGELHYHNLMTRLEELRDCLEAELRDRSRC